MSTIYGDYCVLSDICRVYLKYSISETSTEYTITVEEVGMQVRSGQGLKASVNATLEATGYSDRSNSLSSSSSFRTGNNKILGSKVYKYTKGTSSTTKTFRATMKVPQYGGTSIVKKTFTIPALTKYTISYNGNDATNGSMSNQYKYYGKSVNLTPNAYSKTGFTFNGWTTKPDGTGTFYTDKDTYSTNKNIILYAKWNQDYIAPVFSKYDIIRVKEEAKEGEEPKEDDTGEYLCVKLEFTPGYSPGQEKGDTIKFEWTVDEGVNKYTEEYPTPNRESQTKYKYFKTNETWDIYDINKKIDITCSYTCTDSTSKKTYGGQLENKVIPPSIFPIDVLSYTSTNDTDEVSIGLMYPAQQDHKVTANDLYVKDKAEIEGTLHLKSIYDSKTQKGGKGNGEFEGNLYVDYTGSGHRRTVLLYGPKGGDGTRKIITGTVTIGLDGDSGGSGTFSAPYYRTATVKFEEEFGGTPYVYATLESSSGYDGSNFVIVMNPSTTGCKIRVYSSHTGTNTNPLYRTVRYLAIGKAYQQ